MPVSSHDSGGKAGKHHVLLVDEDPAVAESVIQFLEMHGFAVTVAPTGREGLRLMERERDLDLVLLDIGLPDISGFEVLRQSQDIGVVAPVIVVSTRTEEQDRLRALGLGARDYFTKPFDPDELAARIRTVVGDTDTRPVSPDGRYKIGRVVVDLGRGVVQRGDRSIELPEPQRDLLLVLLASRGEAVSRKRLLEEGLGIDQDTALLTVPLEQLRAMLRRQITRLQELVENDPHRPQHIEEVYGQGYRLRET